MDQKPVTGFAPLDPPSAEVARFYLEEAEAVDERREERIDRRLLARLHLINGAVLAVYFTLLMTLTLAGAGAGAASMGLMIPFWLWLQLLENLGVSADSRRG